MILLPEQFFKGLFDCGRPFDWPVDTRLWLYRKRPRV